MTIILLAGGPIAAQNGEGRVGIGTTAPLARLHVQDSSVLFIGSVNDVAPAPLPIEGEGTRLFWYPDLAAFRAGHVTGAHWNRDSIGIYSVAMGRSTIASEWGSIAMGYGAKAKGIYATAFGTGTISAGNSSFAAGAVTAALGNSSTAFGEYTSAIGHWSTALGRNTIAGTYGSLAIGRFNIGAGDPELWYDTDPVFEIGIGTSDDDRANAMTIYKNGTVLMLGEPQYETPYDVPIATAGTRAMWYPEKAALRVGTVTNPNDWSTDSIGYQSVALGRSTRAVGHRAFAVGDFSVAHGPGGIAMGDNAESYHTGSVALGFHTLATGHQSTAMGGQTVASGSAATAMGWSTTASGYASVAMGQNTTASGDHSTALGLNTNATGNSSIAMGYWTTAFGTSSIALGSGTHANGNQSTAIGENTEAQGLSSIAMGSFTTASGYASAALGRHTTAAAYASVAIGQYNIGDGSISSWIPTDPLFEIGIGSGSGFTENAMTVLKNGKIGIGTHTPDELLDVSGTIQIDNTLKANDADGINIATDDNITRIKVSDNGNIGIGTTNPSAQLDVVGTLEIDNIIKASDADGLYLRTDDNATRIRIHDNGNIGIGTNLPGSHRLHVASGGTGSSGATGRIRNFSASGIALSIENTSASANDNVLLVSTQGSTGDIASFDSWHGTASWDREFRFTNNGDGRCDGSWIGGGADYAEFFEKANAAEKFEPGDVICMSPEKANTVVKASSGLEQLIVGVYSTNPVVVGNSSAESDPENAVLVGMMGVVSSKVSVENGSIMIGDFLTLSATPGVASKAVTGGMVIGRAMENFEGDSTGMIKVMVGPQWVDLNDQSETSMPKTEVESINEDSFKDRFENAELDALNIRLNQLEVENEKMRELLETLMRESDVSRPAND